LGNFLSGRFSVRVGINGMILYGSLVTVIGLGIAILITATGFGSPWVFFGFSCFVGLGNGMTIPNATSGLLSVRPHLAGSASGLGAAIMIGGGAALSVFAGIVLKMGTTSLPLQLLMFASAVLALVSILYVKRREREIGAVTL
jgi:DHA1 family bicyclomycin/chloramphenicol resistance-like MFS transporter